jgi:type II secretory pathway pseudopilin PulG
VILGALTAIGLPGYLSSLNNDLKRTCHANMTIIATAMQAYRTTDYHHLYPTDLPTLIAGPTSAIGATPVSYLDAVPKCPEDPGSGISPADASAYTVSVGPGAQGPIVITCNADNASHGAWNNGSLTVP